jgi:2-keto-4-pentenoate hydratase
MTDHDLAQLLLAARQSGQPVPTGPAPVDAAQAYRVQALVMAQLGEIGGWKVGSPGPDGPISCAPMPANWIFAGNAVLEGTDFTQREVESEICVRLSADLPPREAPYTIADVLAAIASFHPGIEVLQSRFAEPDAVGPLALLADFIQTGAFVVGEVISSRAVPTYLEQTILPGGPTRTATANPAGDMIRLIRWLADDGAVWAGGLRAGQIVTTGSWTGKTAVPPGGTATTQFAGAAPLSVRFTTSPAEP